MTQPCESTLDSAEHDYNGLSYGGSLWTGVLLYLSLRRRRAGGGEEAQVSLYEHNRDCDS